MKKSITILMYLSFLLLIIGNIYIFVSSMTLSAEMNRFETDIKKINKENMSLEKDVLDLQSIQYAASVSASLDFTKTSAPIYFDTIPFAFNTLKDIPSPSY